MSGLHCVCVGGKSWWSRLWLQLQQLLSKPHLHIYCLRLKGGQNIIEDILQNIYKTDDLIPSEKTFLSFITRCCHFMFPLRDCSPGSDPHDCHDFSVDVIIRP